VTIAMCMAGSAGVASDVARLQRSSHMGYGTISTAGGM